jgi:hypothetical protein
MQTLLKPVIDEFTLARILPHPLRKTGNEFTTRCPFHHDESPSLYINIHKGIYHCFGCGKGGSLLSLITELSQRGGIEVPYIVSPASYKELQSSDITPSEQILLLLDRIDPIRAEKIRQCGKEWHSAQCNDCSTIAAYKQRCHDRLCPSCHASAMAKWWSEHNISATIPNPALICLRTKPAPCTNDTELKALTNTATQMLHSIQRTHHLSAGSYSITTKMTRNQAEITIWLICDADLEKALMIFGTWGKLGGICQLKECVIDQGLPAVLSRITWQTQVEISATNHFDLEIWSLTFKGKKIIQGFGDLYHRAPKQYNKGEDPKNVTCPHCGSKHMTYLGKLSNPTLLRCNKGFIVAPHPTRERYRLIPV